MIVADDHEIDSRQGVEIDAGRANPFGTDPVERTRSLGPDGVGEDIQPRQLDQHGRMVDEGNGDLPGLEGAIQFECRLVGDGVWPFLVAHAGQHLERFPKRRLLEVTGIKESPAIVVIGNRAFRRSASGKDLTGKRLAVWGLAFKPRTNDMRDAPAIRIIEALLAEGTSIAAYDPEAGDEARKIFGDRIQYASNNYGCLEGADALLVVTEWQMFRNPNFERMK